MRESVSTGKFLRKLELRNSHNGAVRVKMQPSCANEEQRQAKQTFDLCRVVDKQKQGTIGAANF